MEWSELRKGKNNAETTWNGIKMKVDGLKVFFKT